MFDVIQSWLTAPTTTELSLSNTLWVLLSSTLLGLLVSLTYLFIHRKEGWAQSFVITLVMLSPVVALIILLIGSNVARAFSLAGAFSLIRFRSAPGDATDITYVLFTTAVGLACGMLSIAYAAVFTVIMCAIMIIIHFTKYGIPKNTLMTLKIMVPENLNFQGVFNDVLVKYTVSYRLKRIKTIEFGSLFEVVYNIKINDKCPQKEFIDALRVLNGNLSISLTLLAQEATDVLDSADTL